MMALWILFACFYLQAEGRELNECKEISTILPTQTITEPTTAAYAPPNEVLFIIGRELNIFCVVFDETCKAAAAMFFKLQFFNGVKVESRRSLRSRSRYG